MANLKETSTWENGIYQIEENDPVHGGEEGITNRPAKQLANRTKWLNDNKAEKNRTITAGNGLTGGGDLSANRSLALGTPSTITATSTNSVTAESHSHVIDKASTTVAGIVQLNDTLISTSNTQALTANQGKKLQEEKLAKVNSYSVGSNPIVIYRDVAIFNVRQDVVRGCIALKLPKQFTTMYMLSLQGFNYKDNSSWIAEISAYQYSVTSVLNTSVIINGNSPFKIIRFAIKEGGHYILLGDENTVWSHPTINIKEVMTHYLNQQHWGTGYEFSIETNISTFNILKTPTIYGTPRALSAEKLVTPRQLSISGDATATANFDGSADANLALTLANTGVTAGNYQSVTVDTKGRVTAGLNIVHGLVTATSATGTANQDTTNSNTYLNLVTRTGTTNSSAGSSTKITGQNGVIVSSDTNGNLLISGDIINNLISVESNKPLSALQGKNINEKIDNLGNKTAWKTLNTVQDLNNLKTEGNYFIQINQNQNTPSGLESRWLFVTVEGSFNNRLVQTVIGDHDVRTVYKRIYYGTHWGNWCKMASTDDNVASATKLQTPRTINGITFDGTQNIELSAPMVFKGEINTVEQLDNAKDIGFYRVNNNPAITAIGLYNFGILYVYKKDSVIQQIYYAHVSNSKGSCATRVTWHNDWTRSANWRIIDAPLNNSLISTATDQALTAAQGKILNDTKVEKAQKSAGTDVRTLKQDGIYALSSGGTNLPTTSGAYKILSMAGDNSAWVHQIAIKAYSTEIWLSSQQASNSVEWLNWKRLDGADWGDIRGKPTTLNTYSNLINNSYLHWNGTATPAPATTDFAISKDRIQGIGNIYINADTNGNGAGTEHILLTASNGVSSDVNTGLAIRSNGVKWKNGRHEIADNGDMIVRNPNGYSGFNLTGTDGSFIRIESNPTMATSASFFGNLIYRNSAGANQTVISLPRKNGTMLLSTDIINVVNSTNTTVPASANAVKIAYDKAVEAEKKALPIGSVVAFPKEISNPTGFLLCNGTTFAQATYPDLYRALGNKTKLPQLTRSDVGQLSYFPSDTIPDGWLECNGQTISQTVYPELYAYLGNKYGANGKLPNAENRFIRNASNGLTVGTIQDDVIKTHTINVPDAGVVGSTMGIFHYGERGASNNQGYNILTYEGADETRPKSIVFKLCIKARNSFDDVQFWIKAYGEVVNVGQLDASKLANDLHNHTHSVSQISDFIAQVQAHIRSGLQIQRKDYSARLTPTHNSFRTQTVNISGSVEVLPDGRIIQRFTFVCPVIYFHRHSLNAFYREKLGVSNFIADDIPLLELPLWIAMPNQVQEASIHLSSSLNHYAFGEAQEWSYDWDSIFNQHINIKDKAYFTFRRLMGSNDEPVTFNIVVEGY